MPGLSNAIEFDALKYYFSTDTTLVTRPTVWWVSLHSGDPGDDGTLNLISGPTRRQVTWNAGSGNTKTSATAQQWTAMPAVGGSGVTFVGIWNASTSGTYLATGQLTTGQPVTAGQTFNIAAGAITLTIE